MSKVRDELREILHRRDHQVIVFDDFERVPDHSRGYFAPSGINASLAPHGWVSGERNTPYHIKGTDTHFISHAGPANEEKLLDLLEEYVKDIMDDNYITGFIDGKDD